MFQGWENGEKGNETLNLTVSTCLPVAGEFIPERDEGVIELLSGRRARRAVRKPRGADRVHSHPAAG